MKRNVDLTENGFFSNNTWLSNIEINTLIFRMLTTEEKFPWDVHLKIDENDQRKSIIAIGNKKTRAKVKEHHQMDSPDYCDCCGRMMNLKPWSREVGICHKCNEHIQKQKDKCKWRKKEEIKNAIIRIA